MTDYRNQDIAYYQRRASQEEEAALHASCPAARERHQELADAYRFRCRALVALGSDDRPALSLPCVRMGAPTAGRMLAA